MERFGKFELLEQIGEGGMAQIFLAKPVDASFSKLVAVKRVLPQLKDEPTFQEMFQREGSIAMRFRHPAIIAVYEMGSVDGQSYISMEYFPGKPVARVMNQLRNKGLALALLDKITIIKKIADALHYIHEFSDYGDSEEIIHRDISPHNVMIGFNGVTKLIDFGIAKDMSHETTKARVLKGKIAYMSPEQVRGDLMGRQTDVFSLGIVFWELLAKKKLFTGTTIEEVSAKVKECRVPSLCDLNTTIPPEINRICLKMLTPQVHLRYQTAGEVAADLNDFLRLASAESREKSLARSMQELFPEELAQLRQKLKEYEGSQEGLNSAHTITNTKAPRLRFKERKRSRDYNIPALLAVALSAVIIYRMWPTLITKIKSATVAMKGTSPVTAPVVPSVAPVERKPAASAWAYVTINADPKARIWINGVLVGTTSVKDVQVPAEKPLTVKVLAKSSKKARIHEFTPHVGSQNYIDLAK